MNYEIVELKEKTLTGFTKKMATETCPMDFWGSFYNDVIVKVKGEVNKKAYGVFYDFEGESFKAMAACEAEENEMAEDNEATYKIPAGKYAKFCLKGDAEEVMPKFWSKIREVNLNRSKKCDFEVFPKNDDDDVDIEIYISLA